MLRLDRAAELRPCRNLPVSGLPLLVVYGENETAEFRRQAQEYEGLWRGRHGNSALLELAAMNHYDAIESLVDPASVLSRKTLAWFGL